MQGANAVRQAMLSLGLEYRCLWLHDTDDCLRTLQEHCPGCDHWIHAAMQAVKCEVVSEIRRLGKRMPPGYLLPKLARWLARQAELDYSDALWATESWAMAMGVIPAAIGWDLSTSAKSP